MADVLTIVYVVGFVAIMAGVIVMARGVSKRSRRWAAGQCVRCGYDLRGSKGDCPECGAKREG